MTSLSTGKFFFFRIYNPNIWSCSLNDKEWFFKATCNFCRIIYTAHLLLDNFLKRNEHSLVPHVTGGAPHRAGQCWPLRVFPVIPLAPPPILRSIHWTEAFHPLLGGSFLYPNQASIFLHLKISYLFFNLQLKQCLWAFSNFHRGPCSLLGALTACLDASIVAITQCGNDLPKLGALGFVLPIVMITILMQRGHTWRGETHPTYHPARASLGEWALAIPFPREGDFIQFSYFLTCIF